MIRNIRCVITGLTPLLPHRYPKMRDCGHKTPEEQAEACVYRDPDGNLMVPAMNVRCALVAGGKYVKVPGVGTAAKLVAACVMVTPQHLLLNQESYTIRVGGL